MFTRNAFPALYSGLLLAVLTLPACRSKSDRDINLPDTTKAPVTLTEQEILDKVLNLPMTSFNYAAINTPPYINNPPLTGADNTPLNNPITNEGATLGRVLFYDKALSVNNKIACASCHKQANSFTDDAQFSTGFGDGKTTRNSMSLANARYYQSGRFFWDERAASLEDQVLMPIQHPVEMGMSLDEVESRLNKLDHYKILFKRAFGDTIILRERVSRALAQFVRSMVSYQSKYDNGIAALGHPPGPGDVFPNFTPGENNGMQLYQQNCARCHGTPLHIGNQVRNNGLDQVYTDNGVGDITKNAVDNGKFKVPSLRNVAVTGPYMHDGRFATLEQVVAHYNNGIQNHPNLDQSLRTPGPNGQPIRLNLNPQQQGDIIAFLNTLTDNQFLTDVKYGDPFKK
jgi:cytochrome c peroxidase